jgi:hypothetical protein
MKINPQYKQFGNTELSNAELLMPAVTSLFLAVFLLTLLMNIGILSLSWFYSYPEIIAWKAQKVDFLKGHFSSEFYIPTTFRNYQLARMISAVLWVLVFSLTLVSLFYRKRITGEFLHLLDLIYGVTQRCQEAFNRLSVAEKAAFFLILLLSVGLRIFLYFYIPPHIDELTTYFQFVDKGPIFISTFYPFPNNHFFFNHIYFFSSLLVDDILLAGRLPSMIFFHFLLILLFFWVLVYLKDKYAAFLSILLCALLFPSSIYGVEARGYMLLSFLAVVAALSLLLAIETRKRLYLYIFVPACVLAAYTVPVFFIPFMGMMIFGCATALFSKNKKLFHRLLISGFCVGTGVLFIYLPVFLFSGTGAVINNPFVTSLEVNDFYSRIFPIVTAEMFSFLAGIPTKGWAIFLLLGVSGMWVFMASNQRRRLWLGFTACIVGCLFLYTLIRKSMMFERSATYNVYFLYTTFALIIFHFFNYFSRLRSYRRLALLLLVGLLMPLAYYQYQYNRYENHLLPDPFYTKSRRILDDAVAENTPVYLGDELLNSYRMVYYQYRLSQAEKPSLLQYAYQNAEILMVNQHKLEILDYDLSNYIVIDSIPYIEGEPENLVLVYKKIKNSQ